ncbi:hypothetical protein AAC387_Pa08g1058 [Persea americana]
MSSPPFPAPKLTYVPSPTTSTVQPPPHLTSWTTSTGEPPPYLPSDHPLPSFHLHCTASTCSQPPSPPTTSQPDPTSLCAASQLSSFTHQTYTSVSSSVPLHGA